MFMDIFVVTLQKWLPFTVHKETATFRYLPLPKCPYYFFRKYMHSYSPLWIVIEKGHYYKIHSFITERTLMNMVHTYAVLYKSTKHNYISEHLEKVRVIKTTTRKWKWYFKKTGDIPITKLHFWNCDANDVSKPFKL